eukprot:6201571-Pleurochrysis_carterae.AAC.9
MQGVWGAGWGGMPVQCGESAVSERARARSSARRGALPGDGTGTWQKALVPSPSSGATDLSSPKPRPGSPAVPRLW